MLQLEVSFAQAIAEAYFDKVRFTRGAVNKPIWSKIPVFQKTQAYDDRVGGVE